jgi:DNA-3-methyladenine glycosylase
MRKLKPAFYRRSDVVLIAKELLGKLLVTNLNGAQTIGRIVEVEAYNGESDKASHAYGGRRTRRTEIMYSEGGVAYVYLIYGIHSLFNIVTNFQDIPHAVLIRAIEPVKGVATMIERMGRKEPGQPIGRGPGNVSKAMGISTSHTGTSLNANVIYLAEDDFDIKNHVVISSPRIGVDYAGEDAGLFYRFYLKENKYVSGPGPKR